MTGTPVRRGACALMLGTILVGVQIGCDSADGQGADDVAFLEEDLRLGSVHDGPLAFGRVAALEADSSGQLYVADGISKRVHVFTSDGQPLRTLGGDGSGPGEFRMISGLAIDPAGELWVMDPSASRLTVYRRDGELRGTVSRPFSRTLTIPWLGRMDEQGFVHDMTAAAPSDGGGTRVIVRYRVSDEELIGVDSVRLPLHQPLTYESASGNVRMVGTVPWASAQRWDVAPDGTVWIGLTGDYRLDRITAAGDTLTTLRHSHEPVRVTDSERDSVATSGVDADRIPRVKPAWRSLFVADDGRVWVEPWTSDIGSVWDVFGPSGDLLGRVRSRVVVETEDPRPIVRDGYMYAVTLDELDVPYVVRLRVPSL